MFALLAMSVLIITGINGSNYASDNNYIILLVMDTGTIIIGLVLTMLFISPFFFLRDTKRKTREKELLNSLQELALRNNSKLTEHKIWNNSAIGIDKDARLLLFVYKSEKQSYDKVIHLTEIQSCKVATTSHTTGFKHESYKVTDVISLAFEFRNKTRPNAVIEIYNDDVDGLTLDGENQLAEEWAKIINSVIKPMDLAKSA